APRREQLLDLAKVFVPRLEDVAAIGIARGATSEIACELEDRIGAVNLGREGADRKQRPSRVSKIVLGLMALEPEHEVVPRGDSADAPPARSAEDLSDITVVVEDTRRSAAHREDVEADGWIQLLQ